MESIKSLHCNYCNKPVKSLAGKANHEKICTQGKNMSENEYSQPSRDFDRRDYDERRKEPIKQDAFIMYSDHIPMLLNVDLAIEIGRIILRSGSRNKAVMAFAHKCVNLSGEESEFDEF